MMKYLPKSSKFNVTVTTERPNTPNISTISFTVSLSIILHKHAHIYVLWFIFVRYATSCANSTNPAA